MFFSKWFSRKPKQIAFLDGDNPLPGVIAAHAKHLKGVETHLVRAMTEKSGEPHILRNLTGINKIYLRGYTVGKEVTDKFIGAYIQKAIQDGYKEITVVSSDYDFIDIFKMAVLLNPEASNVSFRMIIPNSQGRLHQLPANICNISIIREATVARL
jgi:hypothetical protein